MPMEGNASPRNPRVAMRTRLSSGSLEVAWRCTASPKLGGIHPDAVIGNLDAGYAAFLQPHRDPAGARVKRILHQLLHRCGRPFDHLARGDAVYRRFGQQADARLR